MRDVNLTPAQWPALPGALGVLITRLAGDGWAERVGLHTGSATLREALAPQPGQRVLGVVRGPGSERSLTITLVRLPAA